jgi:hypothetical protein
MMNALALEVGHEAIEVLVSQTPRWIFEAVKVLQ